MRETGWGTRSRPGLLGHVEAWRRVTYLQLAQPVLTFGLLLRPRFSSAGCAACGGGVGDWEVAEGAGGGG